MSRSLFLLSLLLWGSLLACRPPKPAVAAVSQQRLLFMAELKDDPAVIARYEYYHRANNLWPEVARAARIAGFTSITIHRFGNRIVMMQEFPANADKRKMDSIYVASSPKLAEWGKLMATLQQAPAGAKADQSWVEMIEIYHHPNP